MRIKPLYFFVKTGGFFLLLSGVAKIFSSFGSAPILRNFDPILFVSFRHVFWIVGTIEVVTGVVCLLNSKINLQIRLIAWLATGFSVYRFGLFWVDYRKPCHCLGNLTDALNISPQTADTVMKIILGYLLIGSYGALFWLWRQGGKSSVPPAAPAATSIV